MSFKDIWNNGIDFENFDKKWLVLLVFPGIFWFFWNYQKMITYDGKNDFYKNHIEDEFNSKVIYKKVAKWHNNHYGKHFDRATLQLSDSTEVFGYYSIFEKVNVGDSIIKEKRSTTIKIVKKDTIIYNHIWFKDKFRFEIIKNTINEK